MTLRLSVKIDGDASGLKQAGGEAIATADRVSAAMRGAAANAAAPGLRPDQWKNLGFQLNDVATSLASGAAPMQVLAQQGGQVLGVLQDAPGGVGGALRAVAGRTVGLVASFTGVTAAALAFGGAALLVRSNWRASQDEIERGLLGIGRLSRATAADINRIATGNAAGLGVGDARGIATAVAGTGRVDVSNIPGVVGLAPGYARAFGKGLTETGGDLARIFADPVRGAAELDARLGSLDDRTRSYIRTLTEQGRSQEAIQAMVRAFGPDLDAAAEKTSLWARAWNAVTGAADAAGRVVSNAIDGAPLEDRLAAAEARLKALQSQAAGLGTSELNAADLAREKALRDRGTPDDIIRRLVGDRLAAPRFVPPQDLQRAEADRDRLRAEKDRADKAAAEASRQAQLRDQSKRVGDAVRGALPEIGHLDALRAKVEALKAATGNADLLGRLGVSADQASEAVKRTQGALDSYMTAEEKARASEELTIRAINARTDAEKAAIAAAQKRLDLSGQSVAAAEREAQAQAAAAAVMARAARESEDRLRAARDKAAITGLPSYPRQLAEHNAKWRPILERSAEASGPAGVSSAAATGGAGRLDPAAGFSYLRGQGLNDAQAAAILGNVRQESDFKPTAFNVAEGAYGLYQTRLDRLTNLKSFATGTGREVSDPKAQLDFMLAEMRGSERNRGGAAFLAAGDLGSANAALKRFIRYGDASEGARLGFGADYLRQFAGAGAGGSGSTGVSATAVAGGASSTDRETEAIERRMIEHAAINGPLADANRGLRDQADALRVQAAVFGLSTEAAARLSAEQRLLGDYTRAGVRPADASSGRSRNTASPPARSPPRKRS